MHDDGDQGHPGNQVPPPKKDYSVGRKLRGLSAEEDNRYAGLRRGAPADLAELSSQELVTIALELGFPWTDFGITNDPNNPTLCYPRAATDAEALFLQVPARIPVGFYATFFGASSPALFWGDLGFLMPKDVPRLEVRELLPTWWQAIHLARDTKASQDILGEPVSLVVSGHGFDGHDFEISLAPGSIGAAFGWAPRGLVMAPKVEFDEGKRHREIIGFGFSQCIFFSRIHLRGGVSGSLYGPERLPMGKGVVGK